MEVAASGFEILEQSAKANGTALAGAGSSGRDAGAAWFNPAAMSLLDREVLVAGHFIAPDFEFSDRGSSQRLAGGTVPLLPEAAGTRSGGKNAFVPHLSYVQRLGERWHAGITLNAPFGLTTDYGSNWKGQYQAVLSEIIDYNLNLAVAWRASESLVLGAGASVNYVEATLSNAIDFAAICSQLVGGECPNGAVPGQGRFDGFVSNQGDDTSFGANLGLLWEVDGNTRLGVTYRSEIAHKLQGDTDFTTPDSLGGLESLGPFLGEALASAFADTGNRAELTLPASAAISAWHRFASDRRFAVMADVTWTGWSSVQSVRIEFDNPATPDSELVLRWRDAWRYAIGAEFSPDDTWTWRAGAAFDETPARGPTLASARLPANDRIWLTLGATWQWSRDSEVDLAVAHIFLDDSEIDSQGVTGDRLKGRFEAQSTVLSLGWVHRF